ncbi:MAG: LysM peptidoglycan-binding domain-containing protein [Vampirovibrionales bacterium]|nr:LysM peptidoglycan-binding domain-containing protein [Vampirovibrionales bacterium]
MTTININGHSQPTGPRQEAPKPASSLDEQLKARFPWSDVHLPATRAEFVSQIFKTQSVNTDEAIKDRFPLYTKETLNLPANREEFVAQIINATPSQHSDALKAGRNPNLPKPSNFKAFKAAADTTETANQAKDSEKSNGATPPTPSLDTKQPAPKSSNKATPRFTQARKEMRAKYGSVVKSIQAERRQFDQHSATAPTKHTIRAGQTAYDIAAANGLTLQDLKAFNPNQNLNRIYVGRTLNLTNSEATKTTSSPSETPNAAKQGSIPASTVPESARASAEDPSVFLSEKAVADLAALPEPTGVPLPTKPADVIHADAKDPAKSADQVAQEASSGTAAGKTIEVIPKTLDPYSQEGKTYLNKRAQADLSETEALVNTPAKQRDGKLSKTELTRLFTKSNEPHPTGLAKNYFRAYDLNRDGFIDGKENAKKFKLEMDPRSVNYQSKLADTQDLTFDGRTVTSTNRLFLDDAVRNAPDKVRAAARKIK